MQAQPHDLSRSLRPSRTASWLDRAKICLAALVATLFTVACSEPSTATSTGAPASVATDSVAPAASDARATSPPAPWEDAIRAFEAADAATPPPSGANLFLGSSTIRLWDLRADFDGFACVQRGFGGSEVTDSVRYAPRIVLPCKPRVIVFYAGDNDIANGKTPAQVFASFSELVELVHRALPDTRIVFVSIKPSLQRWALADRMRETNELVRALSKRDALVEFVDVWPTMLGPDGRPRADFLLEDGLHLSRDGYRAWADLVRPHLVR
jgi:hypothetical protein